MRNKEIFKVSLSSCFNVGEFRDKYPNLSADQLTDVMTEQFTNLLGQWLKGDSMPDGLAFEFSGTPKQVSGVFECGGCGCSFDLDNKKERQILKKHNEGVYPCETFNWFCNSFGSRPDCRCGECVESDN